MKHMFRLLCTFTLLSGCSEIQTKIEFASSAAPVSLNFDMGSNRVVNVANQSSFAVQGDCNREDTSVVFSSNLGSAACVNNRFETVLNLTSMPQGIFDITATMLDPIESVSLVTSLLLEKDTIAPVVSVSSHSNGDFIIFNNSEEFIVSGSCNETGQVISFSHGSGSVVCDGVNFNGTVDVSSLPEGAMSFVISLSDESGNETLTPPIDLIKGTPFVSTWQIDPGDLVLDLPLKSSSSYNFSVDWGDGTPVQFVNAHDDLDASHTYSTDGAYNVKITGLCEGFGSSSGGAPYKLQLVEVSDLGHVGWKDLSNAFSNADNLINVLGGNTSMVTNMQSMFAGADNAMPDGSSWDVSNVTSMSSMFSSAASANPNTTNWNVSSVVSMSYMFRRAYMANPNTVNWNTESVQSMYQMFFQNAVATPNTTNWDTSMVSNMREMFRSATSANPDTSNWITSSVTTMQLMFFGASSANPDTSNWDTSLVANMTQTFSGASSANPDLSSWDFTSVTSMGAFLSSSNISNTNYSNFLINADSQVIPAAATYSVAAQYQPAAAAARANLIAGGWVAFTDGGAE